jgi:hypothetical protein
MEHLKQSGISTEGKNVSLSFKVSRKKGQVEAYAEITNQSNTVKAEDDEEDMD